MRFLTRLLIWWRWPMALSAALLLLAMLLSGWFTLFSRIPWFPECLGSVSEGQVFFWHQDDGIIVPMTIELKYDANYRAPNWYFWRFGFSVEDPQNQSVIAPLWVVALPPASLATAGFWLRRRQRVPSECKACRHPLMGAAVCPECGLSVSAS